MSLFRFLWNSDVDKVKRKIVPIKIFSGRANKLDLKIHIKELKSTWIRRIRYNRNSKRYIQIQFISTYRAKLQWLQYQTNQNIFTTNSIMFEIGKVDS